MTWKIHDKEFQSVLSLPAPERYAYFLKKVADWKVIWGLGSDEGWAVGSDEQGQDMMPVWPHERYAAACASGPWVGNEPRPITLEDWLEKWILGMINDKLLVAVFPTPEGRWVPVTPERLKEDLEEELSRLMDVG